MEPVSDARYLNPEEVGWSNYLELQAVWAWEHRKSGQQTPRRWGLGNPAEETICRPDKMHSKVSGNLLLSFRIGNSFAKGKIEYTDWKVLRENREVENAMLKVFKDVSQTNAEGPGYLQQGVYRNGTISAFNLANVNWVEVCLLGKLFLGNSCLFPKFPDICTD